MSFVARFELLRAKRQRRAHWILRYSRISLSDSKQLTDDDLRPNSRISSNYDWFLDNSVPVAVANDQNQKFKNIPKMKSSNAVGQILYKHLPLIAYVVFVMCYYCCCCCCYLLWCCCYCLLVVLLLWLLVATVATVAVAAFCAAPTVACCLLLLVTAAACCCLMFVVVACCCCLFVGVAVFVAVLTSLRTRINFAKFFEFEGEDERIWRQAVSDATNPEDPIIVENDENNSNNKQETQQPTRTSYRQLQIMKGKKVLFGWLVGVPQPSENRKNRPHSLKLTAHGPNHSYLYKPLYRVRDISGISEHCLEHNFLYILISQTHMV